MTSVPDPRTARVPQVAPMLAQTATALPRGGGWAAEIKWDGWLH